MKREARAARRGALCAVVWALSAPSVAWTAPDPSLREAMTPLAVEGAERREDEHQEERASELVRAEEPRELAPSRPPPPRIDAGQGPLRVAIGLGPGAPGSPREQEMLRMLEASTRSSSSPQVELRRLRPGGGDGRVICRDGQDDLVILIDYLADMEAPALLPHDCALDRPLGTRSGRAAEEPGLVAALWREHAGLVQDGAQARRAGLGLSPRARRGLIAGSAIAAVAAAVAVVLAASLRTSTAVITVSQ